METIIMEYDSNIETKQGRITLIEWFLNAYGDKHVFLQTDQHTQ